MAKKKNTNKKKITNKKSIVVEEEMDNNQLYEKIAMVLGILIFIVLFYLLTLYITNKHTEKDKTDDKTTTEATISYDDISLGTSLSMSDSEYLVIYYDKSNEELVNNYTSLINDYKSKENSLKIYTVDMSNPLNKTDTTKDVNTTPLSEDELVIKGPTLIKVSDKAVLQYIEGDDIVSYFDEAQ